MIRVSYQSITLQRGNDFLYYLNQLQHFSALYCRAHCLWLFSSIIFIHVEKQLYQIFSQPSMEQESSPPTKTRDFACSCGKKYFSYAALFTHIKQKHDGKAPGPIVRPRSQRKRGRPRKTPLPGEDNPNSDSLVNNSNGVAIPNEYIQPLEESEKKTKKAAEMLLSSGSFQAFQTYRGNNIFSSELKNPSLKKVVSDSDNIEKKGNVLQKSKSQVSVQRNMTKISSRNLGEPDNKKLLFLQSHTKSLIELQRRINVANRDEQLLQNLNRKCRLDLDSVAGTDQKCIVNGINKYLTYIRNILSSSHYLLIKYILVILVQFVLRNDSVEKASDLTIQQTFKSIEPFLQSFQAKLQASDFKPVLQPISPSNQSSLQMNLTLPSFIPVDLAMNIIMLFAYWINLDVHTHDPCQQSLSFTTSKKINANTGKQSSTENKRCMSLTQQLNNLMRVESHRHEQPRIINTIEDILAENNSDSEYNSSEQIQQEGGSDSQDKDLDNQIVLKANQQNSIV